MAPTILITRPEASAHAFAEALRAVLGDHAEIVVSPMLKIEMMRDELPLDGKKTLIFTSAHAIEAFAELTDMRDVTCYTVGQSSAAVARDVGFEAIDGGGTADLLVERLIADRPPTPCLYLRGRHIARDLCETLNSHGLETYEHVIYDQMASPLSCDARQNLNGPDPIIVPLFSPRSAQLLFDDLNATAPVWAAAISENVARAVPVERVSRLEVAEAPTPDAMLRLTAKLFVAANQLESNGPSQ